MSVRDSEASMSREKALIRYRQLLFLFLCGRGGRCAIFFYFLFFFMLGLCANSLRHPWRKGVVAVVASRVVLAVAAAVTVVVAAAVVATNGIVRARA